ncbi:hypothetical protein [Mesorhizobium sp. WSM3860]|nr:hypothetical protein [Mesorhizobium sp. WSM3860]
MATDWLTDEKTGEPYFLAKVVNAFIHATGPFHGLLAARRYRQIVH